MKIFISGVKTFISGRYTSLLICLVLVMMLQPTIDTQIGKLILEVFFIAVLLDRIAGNPGRQRVVAIRGGSVGRQPGLRRGWKSDGP